MAGNDEKFARLMMESGYHGVHNSGQVVNDLEKLALDTVAGGHTVQTDVGIKDPEYIKIKTDLEKIGRKLTRLVKLDNTILAENFETESLHLRKMKKQPDFPLNIQCLYHGTTAPLDQICDEGLDERLSRRGRFGRGIYFSDNPAKCCKYAEHKTSKPYLLRCRVILGDVKKYELGEEDTSLTREPLKTVKDGRRVYYDSVVGQPHKDKPEDTEYVIYDKRRALIDYIVYYIPPQRPSQNVTTEQTRDSDGRSSPLSGQSSPRSGRCSPSRDYVIGAAAAAAEQEEDAVPRVNICRPRVLKPSFSATEQPSSEPRPNSDLKTNSNSDALPKPSDDTPLLSGSSSIVEQPSPQMMALKNLLSLKDQVSQSKYDELTRLYLQTYGAAGDQALTSMSAVMSDLISQFKAITRCLDDDLCRSFIEIGNMDLNRAIEAYIDATS